MSQPAAMGASQPVSTVGRIATWFVRHPWWTLITWSLLLSAVHITSHGASWHFLETGVSALFSGHPLTLFALHPELQMGPLTFVLAAPFVLVLHGIVGEIAVMILMLALGLLTVREVRLVAGDRVRPNEWLIAALLMMAGLTELAIRWGHLDDAMALYLGALGLRMALTRSTYLAAVFLALAVDFKPWAVPFVAFLFLAPVRKWVPAGLIWVAIVAIIWSPFVFGDSGTLRALHYGIPIDPASTLWLIYPNGGLTPSWDRYAQIGIGFALATVAVWRKRWPSAFAIVIIARLLLDPGVKNYYDAGLLVGTALFDVVISLTSIPWMTVAAAVFVYLPSYVLVNLPPARGIVRTVALVSFLFLVLLLPPNRRPATTATGGPPDAPPMA